MTLATAPRLDNKQTPAPSAKRFSWTVAWQTVLALILLIAIPEFVFALAGVGEQEFLRPDKTLGFCPMEGKPITWRQEGFSRTNENSLGMPDVERTIAKAPGTFRIALVGDSLTQAFEVDRSQGYCQVLEKELNKAYPDKKFEVLNFSVSAVNLGQLYLMLKNRVWKFQPDLIVLTERVDGVMLLAPNPAGGFLYARPSFFAGANGELIQDNTVQDLWNKSPDAKRFRDTAFLRRYSRIWGVVSNCMVTYTRWQKKWVEDMKHIRFVHHAAPSQNAEMKVAAGDTDVGTTKFLWPIANALLGTIAEECRLHHTPILVLRMPGTTHKHNDVETALLQKSCDKFGLPMLDLTPAFDNVQTGTFYIFHLTPQGHKMVADELLHYLQAHNFLQG